MYWVLAGFLLFGGLYVGYWLYREDPKTNPGIDVSAGIGGGDGNDGSGGGGDGGGD
jgi:hypothetical protein